MGAGAFHGAIRDLARLFPMRLPVILLTLAIAVSGPSPGPERVLSVGGEQTEYPHDGGQGPAQEMIVRSRDQGAGDGAAASGDDPVGGFGRSQAAEPGAARRYVIAAAPRPGPGFPAHGGAGPRAPPV